MFEISAVSDVVTNRVAGLRRISATAFFGEYKINDFDRTEPGVAEIDNPVADLKELLDTETL